MSFHSTIYNKSMKAMKSNVQLLSVYCGIFSQRCPLCLSIGCHSYILHPSKSLYIHNNSHQWCFNSALLFIIVFFYQILSKSGAFSFGAMTLVSFVLSVYCWLLCFFPLFFTSMVIQSHKLQQVHQTLFCKNCFYFLGFILSFFVFWII